MQHKLVFIFIDGIGLGADHPDNPFAILDLAGFSKLSDGQAWIASAKPVRTDALTFSAIDATLGMPGLPQSGTGQATLFTGINCAELAGKHFGPYPHSTTKGAIKSSNVFSRLLHLNHSVAFANAFPPRFFEHAKKRNRWSVTTRSCLDSDTEIRTMKHLAEGTALAADITGNGLKTALKLPVFTISEVVAAENLIRLATQHSFTLFEYFHTDKAGHNQSHNQARRYLESLDRFLSALLVAARADDITLILTSDHGNLEDLRVKTHTYNPVPFAVAGPSAPAFSDVVSLIDVTHVIQSLFDGSVS